MNILKVYFLLAIGLSLTLTGIGSGGCRAGIEVPEDSLTGSEGEVAAIAIAPDDVTTIDDSGTDMYAVCEGVPCEDVSWTFVDQTTATLELELDDPLLSSRPPPRNHKVKQQKIGDSNFWAKVVPDSGAVHGEPLIIRVCRNDQPEVCTDKEVTVVRGTVSSLEGILNNPIGLAGSTMTALPDDPSFKWDTVGCFQTNNWSMCLKSAFVEPVKDVACDGSLKPGTFLINFCGSKSNPSCADYKINIFNDEYACLVHYLRLPEENGCPGDGEPEWVLKDGSSVAFSRAVKNLDAITDEALTLAASLFNQICFQGDMTKGELDSDVLSHVGEDINKRSFGELIQCVEGAVLVVSQIGPWVESVFDTKFFRFAEDKPATMEALFQCKTSERKAFDQGEYYVSEGCNANFVSKGTCDRYDPTKCGCWSLTRNGQSVCESYHTDYTDGKTTDYHNCFWGTVNGATGCFAEGSQVGDNACRK